MRISLLSTGLVAAGALGVLCHGIMAPSAAAEKRSNTCGAVDGQVYLASGVTLIGEDGDGRPGKPVNVPGFWIDRHEVTNQQFAAFVRETGYRTQAEREGMAAVFIQPTTVSGLGNAAQWWRFVRGADWRHPTGPSQTAVSDNLPVVQVTFEDAQAYARWAGGRLPTEVEWGRAARGEQYQAVDPASWAYDVSGKPLANTWQGIFPVVSQPEDGYPGLAPVGCFPANPQGLYDLIGNAWEWTVTPIGGESGRRILKGGSFLCSFNYCANFRPAGWQAQEQDLPTSHISFRVVRDGPPPDEKEP